MSEDNVNGEAVRTGGKLLRVAAEKVSAELIKSEGKPNRDRL